MKDNNAKAQQTAMLVAGTAMDTVMFYAPWELTIAKQHGRAESTANYWKSRRIK